MMTSKMVIIELTPELHDVLHHCLDLALKAEGIRLNVPVAQIQAAMATGAAKYRSADTGSPPDSGSNGEFEHEYSPSISR